MGRESTKIVAFKVVVNEYHRTRGLRCGPASDFVHEMQKLGAEIEYDPVRRMPTGFILVQLDVKLF